MTFKSVPMRLAGAFFLCLLLLGQAGCFQRHDRADFTVINGPDPEALDPAIITSQADGRIVAAMFEGLTRFNAVTSQAEPALAKRWEFLKRRQRDQYLIADAVDLHHHLCRQCVCECSF